MLKISSRNLCAGMRCGRQWKDPGYPSMCIIFRWDYTEFNQYYPPRAVTLLSALFSSFNTTTERLFFLKAEIKIVHPYFQENVFPRHLVFLRKRKQRKYLTRNSFVRCSMDGVLYKKVYKKI